MPPLTASQLRAARALLHWTRAHLSSLSGVSEPTLHRFENDLVSPSSRTQEKIRFVLENGGIDFIGHSGVQLRPEEMEILEGEVGLQRFCDLVFRQAEHTSGVFRQNNLEDDLFFKNHRQIAEEHQKRMTNLKKNKPSLCVRVLIREQIKNFLCPAYATYKWFSKENTSSIPYYVFGDRVAIFAIDTDKTPKIYLITSPLVAATYQNQFDSLWKAATDPATMRKTGKTA